MSNKPVPRAIEGLPVWAAPGGKLASCCHGAAQAREWVLHPLLFVPIGILVALGIFLSDAPLLGMSLAGLGLSLLALRKVFAHGFTLLARRQARDARWVAPAMDSMSSELRSPLHDFDALGREMGEWGQSSALLLRLARFEGMLPEQSAAFDRCAKALCPELTQEEVPGYRNAQVARITESQLLLILGREIAKIESEELGAQIDAVAQAASFARVELGEAEPEAPAPVARKRPRL